MKYILPEHQREQQRLVHPSQRQHHITPINSPLYVVTAIENPNRYYSRYKLYESFAKHVEESGGILFTVELALRDRHFEVTDPDNPHHIQLRSPSQLWHKENLLNIAISRLPSDWEYVAWVDSDIQFARPDWTNETLHLLQHYKMVQMFSHAIDLSPTFDPVGPTFNSFVFSYLSGRAHPIRINSAPLSVPVIELPAHPPYGSGHKLWHSGFAWAARRSALADLGGLGEIGILGSGDHHMACALIDRVSESIHAGMQQSFKDYWKEWQARAHRSIKRNIGCMSGTIFHYWHGKKVDRRYVDRWKILVDDHFDYLLDLKKDVQGVLTLTDRNIKLRDDIRAYFAVRNEDSIDL